MASSTRDLAHQEPHSDNADITIRVLKPGQILQHIYRGDTEEACDLYSHKIKLKPEDTMTMTISPTLFKSSGRRGKAREKKKSRVGLRADKHEAGKSVFSISVNGSSNFELPSYLFALGGKGTVAICIPMERLQTPGCNQQNHNDVEAQPPWTSHQQDRQENARNIFDLMTLESFPSKATNIESTPASSIQEENTMLGDVILQKLKAEIRDISTIVEATRQRSAINDDSRPDNLSDVEIGISEVDNNILDNAIKYENEIEDGLNSVNQNLQDLQTLTDDTTHKPWDQESLSENQNNTTCFNPTEQGIVTRDDKAPGYNDLASKKIARVVLKSLDYKSVGVGLYACNTCDKVCSSKSGLLAHKEVHVKSQKFFFKCDLCGRCFFSKEILENHKQTHAGKKIFKCEICHKLYCSARNLALHKELHKGSQTHKCDTCGNVFRDKNTLYTHKRKKHDTVRQHICTFCRQEFSFKHELNAHEQANLRARGMQQCGECGQEFEIKCQLKMHKASHVPERPFGCDVCGKRFRFKNQLRDHSKIHNGKSDQYKCEKCGRGFARTNNLYVHQCLGPGPLKSLEEHNTLIDLRNAVKEERQNLVNHKELSFACDLCDKEVSSRSDLLKHKQTHTCLKIFSCDLCGKIFDKHFEVKPHMIKHLGERSHGCDKCEKKYFTGRQLKIHQSAAHGESGSFKCEICGKKYTSKISYQMHKRKHNPNKPYGCDLCGDKFHFQSELNLHKKLNITNQPQLFKCPDCSETFSYRCLLRAHKRTHVQAEERPFKCDVCDKAFRAKSHLRMHKRDHAEVKPYKCSKCERSFTRTNNLYAHKCSGQKRDTSKATENSLALSGNKPSPNNALETSAGLSNNQSHTNNTVEAGLDKATSNVESLEDPTRKGRLCWCVTCGKIFPDVFQKHTHTCIRSHENSHFPKPKLRKKHSCSKCNKVFLHMSGLKRHMSKHTGQRPFQCRFCDKTFVQKFNLECHMRVHTGEKPFQCDECGKAFSTMTALYQHQKIHSKAMPYLCDFCGCKFRYSQALLLHKKTHEKDRPFSCEMCGKRFLKRDAVKSHVMTHLGLKRFFCPCGKQYGSESSIYKHHKKSCAFSFKVSRSYIDFLKEKYG